METYIHGCMVVVFVCLFACFGVCVCVCPARAVCVDLVWAYNYIHVHSFLIHIFGSMQTAVCMDMGVLRFITKCEYHRGCANGRFAL